MSNNVTLIGNLVEDPELRFTPSGVAMAKIRIAVNQDMASSAEPIRAGDEVAFFPPVTGG